MSILCTADFQAEFNNLDLCEQAWNETLGICKEQYIKWIAVCGDGKQSYNPVDIEVVKWWQHAIKKATYNGIQVLFLLGNHDRIGQYSNASNWLPILRRAGAITFDKPGIKNIGERRVFILPFSGMDETRRRAKELLRENPKEHLDILLFHANLLEARYNQHGQESDSSLSFDDLCPDKYLCCVGGDIHLPQKIGKNGYYTGSPFCTSWGEVNQRKRYLVVGKSGITSIHSRIPRWFDPSISGFQEARPKTWEGARIRYTVQCDANKDYGRELESARRYAEKKYKGATIFVIPKFREDSRRVDYVLQASDSDERKLQEYTSTTGLRRRDRHLVLAYMLEKLSHFQSGLRTDSKVKFVSAWGRNFLSFKKVELKFKPGITVIRGVNYDRNKKSNGSGKTGLVQLLPVAFFGKTFKDQKSDHWSNRWVPKERALVTVHVKTNHKEVVIIRGRRPPYFKLQVDGHDRSSGMKSNDRKGTQERVEQFTGITWQTLANAVYIDRTVADSFLSGTNKERTDILSRFQNLERFEKALLLVKGDYKKNNERLDKYDDKISYTKGAIKECKQSLVGMKQLSRLQIDGAYKVFVKAKKKLKKWHQKNDKKILFVKSKGDRVEKKYQKYAKRLEKVEDVYVVMEADANRLVRQVDLLGKLHEKGNCPMCSQPVTKDWMNKHSEGLIKELEKSKARVTKHFEQRAKLRKKVFELEALHTEIDTVLGHKRKELDHLKLSFRTSEQQYNELFKDQHQAKGVLNKTKHKLITLKYDYKDAYRMHEKLCAKNKLYKYAMEAFSRDGIPAFLNMQLVPVLNKASDYYAEIFSDSEIQVKFTIENGEFVPQVINVNGGEDINDQSTGERALAGLIASFALREVAPRCNVLILDEPGEGLDSQTAKQFAHGLQKLKNRFGSIYITTHNDHIMSELNGERLLTVEKRNRISKLV